MTHPKPMKGFDRLAARNLLYLQTEVAELERLQDKLDREASEEEKRCERNLEWLKQRATEPSGEKEREKLDILQRTRRKLKEYEEALIRQSFLLANEAPTSRSLEAFQKTFHNVQSGGPSALDGCGCSVYDIHRDFVALSKQPEEDRLTGFLRNYLAVLFIKRMTDSPLTYISQRRLNIVVAAINIIMAAILLFGAILNLYFVKDETKRLGLIAGYTVAFTVCVGLITNARRSEVFSACAAYAAVLVVFRTDLTAFS